MGMLHRRHNGKRGRSPSQPMQLLPDQSELRVREPRRDTADIPQFMLLVGDPDQQRGEEGTRAARFDPPADSTDVNH